MKIYEAMAATVPVVSTTIGAEGLDVDDGSNIRLADTPQAFAERCLELLTNNVERQALGKAGFTHVAGKYSWDAVTAGFAQMIAG